MLRSYLASMKTDGILILQSLKQIFEKFRAKSVWLANGWLRPPGHSSDRARWFIGQHWTCWWNKIKRRGISGALWSTRKTRYLNEYHQWLASTGKMDTPCNFYLLNRQLEFTGKNTFEWNNFDLWSSKKFGIFVWGSGVQGRTFNILSDIYYTNVEKYFVENLERNYSSQL